MDVTMDIAWILQPGRQNLGGTHATIET